MTFTISPVITAMAAHRPWDRELKAHLSRRDSLTKRQPLPGTGNLKGNLMHYDSHPGQADTARECADRWHVESTSPSLLTTDNTLERSFFIRMKSTLTKRGVHIKSSGYKSPTVPPPAPPMSALLFSVELTSLDKISDYMDLTPVDIVGKRCYHFIHAEDVEGIRHSHLDLLNKGQCVTKYYRWMQKNGGYIWIQSSATIAINAKNANEKNIIWAKDLEEKDVALAK
ncbi:hypothetical protein GH733_004760 [Mirounga leonina]|nr:hypothetical protein GH733_004760 [Mirounga leonina]